MTQVQLHNLLAELKSDQTSGEMVEHEHKVKLEALVESLEQQEIYPDDFDQFSTLGTQAQELAQEYEQQFPKISALLKSIAQTIENIVR